MKVQRSEQFEAVNKAFTKQASHYDADDHGNPILRQWRRQVYSHIDPFLKPNSNILELNAGTGIDAVYLARQGHRVHATDLSDGMIEQIKTKASDASLKGRLTYQQVSFESLDLVEQRNFDNIFSNFGGLNCIEDLTKVTVHFQSLLKPGGHVTLVMMPPVCPWEILSLVRGNTKAFRRFNKKGTFSQVEGVYFQSYYFSLSKIKLAMGRAFKLVVVEGLGAITPPPSRSDFPNKNPRLFNWLNNLDKRLKNHFPFNRWADHLIVTFQHKNR